MKFVVLTALVAGLISSSSQELLTNSNTNKGGGQHRHHKKHKRKHHSKKKLLKTISDINELALSVKGLNSTSFEPQANETISSPNALAAISLESDLRNGVSTNIE